MSVRDRLRSDRLRAALGEVTIGCEIVVLEETGSTNEVVGQMAKGDWPQGLVVVAEHQTCGRGQHGKRWESAAHKGLCLSVLLRPHIPLGESARLTSWAAQIVASVIEHTCSLAAVVKPPNDVYIGGRKVAGVLVEMLARAGAPHVAVLGIGINVNQTVADFPRELRGSATSIAIAARHRQDRNALAVALLQELNRTYCAGQLKSASWSPGADGPNA